MSIRLFDSSFPCGLTDSRLGVVNLAATGASCSCHKGVSSAFWTSNELGEVLPAAAGFFFAGKNTCLRFLLTCNKLGEVFPAAAGAFCCKNDVSSIF